jgi:hypothetical protein
MEIHVGRVRDHYRPRARDPASTRSSSAALQVVRRRNEHGGLAAELPPVPAGDALTSPAPGELATMSYSISWASMTAPAAALPGPVRRR